ncbi:formylglycine-generating enzyme family protein [bacterium]|nr:formylglycine-generating enzyme family protein [bacterium]
MRLTRYFVIIAAVIVANFAFAGSVVTQRVVNAQAFVKGSTTIALSGQLTEEAMARLSNGEGMAIYNSLDSYLVFPTLLPRTKTGFGTKSKTQNISVSSKNGKFQWTEKDVTDHFTFAVGYDKVFPEKATFKSSGNLPGSALAELGEKKLTVFDTMCAEQGLGYLASLSFVPEKKGKNYQFSLKDKEQGLQVKVSVNAKGKASASYKLPPEFASPAFLGSEYIFTNKYDYSMQVVGNGSVESGFVGPDKVSFRVTENNGKFRYFFSTRDGSKFTNDFLETDLEGDTDFLAVFGNYDLTVDIIGNGSVDVEFIGPDTAEIKVLEGDSPFRYFTVNGEKYTQSSMTIELQEDTEVVVVFGTYDLTLSIVGDGFVGVEFTGPDEAEVGVLEGSAPFRYFTVNGEKCTDSTMFLSLETNTFVEAVFGTYDFSLSTVGSGSASFEFVGSDKVEVRVTEGDALFRYFDVNGVKYYDNPMTVVLTKNTEVEAVFGTYKLEVVISGKGSAETKFTGPDTARITPIGGEEAFYSFSWNDHVSYESPLLLKLITDTVVTATFVKVNYIVVDISGGYTAESWPHRISESGPDVENDACRTTELWLKFVSAGEYRMGSPESEVGRGTREVAHQVTLTKGFYIGVFELTRKQYELIAGTAPASTDDDLCPVTKVTFDSLRGTSEGANWPADDEVDAGSFMGILRAKTGLRFDLPTEAQWEYACRATTTTAFNNGKNLDDDDLNLFEIAYYNANASAPQKVGSLAPNAWGLYDMHGNVWEWCLDWYTNDLGTAPVTDPVGLATGYEKTLRGGSFNDEKSACRSAYRAHTETDHDMDRLGVRPVIN